MNGRSVANPLPRAKLHVRYADQLAGLDDPGRQRLEAEWDRAMPSCLFVRRRTPT